MFLDNKYTTLYYRIIKNARSNKKIVGDGNQIHHIVPRCLGGTDSSDNLVVCTLKQHRICHKILIKMTEGKSKWKMMHAYKLFNKNYDLTGSPFLTKMTKEKAAKGAKTRKAKGSYKTGTENNFAKPEIIKIVKERMLYNNPMKNEKQKERMRIKNNNPKVVPVEIDGELFPSLNAAARNFKTTPHLLLKNYKVQRRPNS